MALNIVIKHKGKGRIAHAIDFFPDRFKSKLRQIAEEAKIDMVSRIEGDRKRSKTPTRKPHLSELIDVVSRDLGLGYTVGIGDVKKIQMMHRDPAHSTDTGKGWKMLEWGGKIPGGGTHPHGDFVGSRFVYNPHYTSPQMHPKKIMQGIHFIANSATNVSLKIQNLAQLMKL